MESTQIIDDGLLSGYKASFEASLGITSVQDCLTSTIHVLTATTLYETPEWLSCLDESDQQDFLQAVEKNLLKRHKFDPDKVMNGGMFVLNPSDLHRPKTCRICRKSKQYLTKNDLTELCESHPPEYCDAKGRCHSCKPGTHEIGHVQNPSHDWHKVRYEVKYWYWACKNCDRSSNGASWFKPNADPPPPPMEHGCFSQLSQQGKNIKSSLRSRTHKSSVETRPTPGCVVSPNHQWRPASSTGKWQGFAGSPAAMSGVIRRKIVSIDAEMVGVRQNAHIVSNEICTFSIIDVLTNEIVMNCIIKPDQKIDHYRERYSGMNKEIMREAENQGKAIIGLKAFHKELFKHIDADTIIMGWHVYNDIRAARLFHPRLFDVQDWYLRLPSGRTKLSDAAWNTLGAKIQRGTHGSCEDALATAELARSLYHPKLKVLQTQKIKTQKKSVTKRTEAQVERRRENKEKKKERKRQDEAIWKAEKEKRALEKLKKSPKLEPCVRAHDSKRLIVDFSQLHLARLLKH